MLSLLQSSFEFREERQISFFLNYWKALACAFDAHNDALRQSNTTAALTLVPLACSIEYLFRLPRVGSNDAALITYPGLFRNRYLTLVLVMTMEIGRQSLAVFFSRSRPRVCRPLRTDEKFAFAADAAFRARDRATMTMLVACISWSRQRDAPHRAASADARL